MPRKIVSTPEIYQIKVTLRHSKPPIWRRLLVSSDTNLGKLHRILQVVMEWNDYHLHLFNVAERTYASPAFELDADDERRVKLSQITTVPKFKFSYEYDFGDSWELELVIEKILPFDPGQQLPQVIAGQRASPLEDSGGVWGYQHLVEVLNNPADPRHSEMIDWVFGDEEPEEGFHFDAEAYDLDAVNEALRSLR